MKLVVYYVYVCVYVLVIVEWILCKHDSWLLEWFVFEHIEFYQVIMIVMMFYLDYLIDWLMLMKYYVYKHLIEFVELIVFFFLHKLFNWYI